MDRDEQKEKETLVGFTVQLFTVRELAMELCKRRSTYKLSYVKLANVISFFRSA